MSILFDQTDFSVVVENRAPPPKPWRWEIYRAGRKSPIKCSSVLYKTVEAANRAGKEALKQLLTKFLADDRASRASIPNSSTVEMSDVSPLDAFDGTLHR
jgi:hypothetical protein